MLIYSVSQKMFIKEMCHFLTQKMLPIALALIKTQNFYLFDPLVKNHPFNMRIFYQNDFARANGNILRIKNNIFWGTLYISVIKEHFKLR